MSTIPQRHGLQLSLLGILLVCISLLSACGFHLRGNYEVPEFLQAVTIKMPDDSDDLAQEIKLALERRNIVPQGGEVMLEIVRERLTRQTATVNSSARAAEYTLIYTVDFRINSVDRKSIGVTQPLILRRSYQYSDNNLVGKNIEEATLLRELRADAAQQIVRQLVTLKAIPSSGTNTQ
jgi:LPS-assembly lipoprotein